ncbi:crotonase/enoyl-CoA hydratase family protein [Cupriavidus sp. D384]|uniref:crotonase/enoyl-CoA hydratase family protein n=1 Tax=Cupriavidus sp. D384 TaxID=1538095 RepID=UPI00082CF5C5|nr:crotonase/enoyl-CoA hydratase family protein [Cupriavidus sp. D384]
MTEKILIEKNGAVTTIIINRPAVRNALDREATTALGEALQAFERDDSARVAVLWGAGGSFCAGADLKELASGVEYDAWAGVDGPLSKPARKPVIAAIAGHACAGGLGLALWCDIRVAEESASFAVLSRRWGVPMSDGTTVRLPRLIGTSQALDMLLTARMVTAREAMQMGLATRVVPDGSARDAAESLAATMATFPQIAMNSDRESVYKQEGHGIHDALALEAELAEQAKRIEAKAGAARFSAGSGRHGAVA